ncbi:MAG: LysE family transporter [Deltaproteobacteria bacterium]|nr:LysE family transporter [Deltaproteobacteria bacterium]
MVSALAVGTVLGLSAGLAPGPLLTLVITQTLKHNAGEGVKVAAAPLITDLPIILLSLLVLTRLTDFDVILGLISLAGGLYVLHLAYGSLRVEPVNLQASDRQPRSLSKGALINLLNPHPYLFWMTVGAPFILKARERSLISALAFIFSFYVLLVGSKIFLALLTGKSRRFLTGKGYIYVMRVLAALLALFALFLFRDGLVFLGVLP